MKQIITVDVNEFIYFNLKRKTLKLYVLVYSLSKSCDNVKYNIKDGENLPSPGAHSKIPVGGIYHIM